MESRPIIAQLSGALSALKQLPFSRYSASEVTKAIILVEMAIQFLEASETGQE